MKNAVFASVLVATSAALVSPHAFAAAPVVPQAAAGSQAPASGSGQVQMSAEEYKAYNDANTAATPAAKATAFEAYLKAYPNSAVKDQALEQIMFAYVQANDPTNAEAAGDRLLAVDPNNFRAYVIEVQLHRDAGDKATDAAAKLAEYDKAAMYAQKGLAATKPAAVSDADWTTLKSKGYPVFYSAVGTDDLQKKDDAGAVTAFKSELSSVPVAQTEAPGLQLQDTFYLASAYYGSTPPDYINCAYYAARAAAYAPDPYKTQFTQLGKYCYTKYHGKADGYETATATAKDNLTPPDSFASSITPAPKPIDYVKQTVATTPDLSKLALGDKEFILQYGNQPDPKSATQATYSDEVFDTVKGKEVDVPDSVVVAATANQLQVAVSDDSKNAQPPVADFTFNFVDPITTLPAVGSKVDIVGTYTSYTSSPLMITMEKAKLVEKAPARKEPARRAAPRRR